MSVDVTSSLGLVQTCNNNKIQEVLGIMHCLVNLSYDINFSASTISS